MFLARCGLRPCTVKLQKQLQQNLLSSYGTFFPSLYLLLWVLGAFTCPEEEGPWALVNEKLPHGCSARALGSHSPFSPELCRGVRMSKERPSEPQAAKQRSKQLLMGKHDFGLGKKNHTLKTTSNKQTAANPWPQLLLTPLPFVLSIHRGG